MIRPRKSGSHAREYLVRDEFPSSATGKSDSPRGQICIRKILGTLTRKFYSSTVEKRKEVLYFSFGCKFYVLSKNYSLLAHKVPESED